MTADIRNVPGLLKHANGVNRAVSGKRSGARPVPPHQDLTSFIQLSLDDPRSARLLQNAAAHLAAGWPTGLAAATILDEVLALTGADLGNVQITDPDTHELRLTTYVGFSPEFLDHFAVVGDDTSACGRAAAGQRQAVIPDVDADAEFAPHRDVARSSKFRAVQSTPLIDAAGNLVGVVSTHFPEPGSPSDRALELTRLYGLVAGEALARSMPEAAADRGQDGRADEPDQPESSSALRRTTVLELTDTAVRALLSAGMSLANAQSLVNDGPVSDSVAAAIDELDQALGGIRSAVLELRF